MLFRSVTAWAFVPVTSELGLGTALQILGISFNPFFLVVGIILVILGAFIPITKTYIQTCKKFIKRYTSTPYIQKNTQIYKNLSGTTENTYTTFNDGAYNYTISGGTIINKKLSYKLINGVKTYSRDLFDVENPNFT